MRIDESQAVSGFNVGNDHVLNQGGFAGAGLADDVYMSAPVILFDAKKFVGVPVICYSKESNFVFIIAFSH